MYSLPLILAAAVSLASGSVGQAGAVIPAKFRGEWARTLGDCNLRGGENSAGFTVTAKTIVYYEDHEEVKQVRMTGPNSLAYTSKYISTDGEEPSKGLLRLSADGGRMLGADRTTDLVRCVK
ncbi:hypothetical protein [Sphingomonas trueperi]|uniref:hypothetical protein n=1 Tax=Sphingomonas trueperi TaxID=53317 RepID=UPI000EAFD1A0